MKGVLIGACHKSGEFTDDNGRNVPYDNLVLYLQKPIENSNADDRYCEGVGFTTVEAKTPWENFSNVFENAVSSLDELENYVGTEVNYFFNDKKKLDTVLL